MKQLRSTTSVPVHPLPLHEAQEAQVVISVAAVPLRVGVRFSNASARGLRLATASLGAGPAATLEAREMAYTMKAKKERRAILVLEEL